MADNDVQLDLKKRSRRRLVGAIALTLLAAIVLPMVMDSEPRPVSNELQIRIPSQEGSNFASRLIAPPPVSPALPVQPAPAAAVAQSAVSAASSAPVASSSRPSPVAAQSEVGTPRPEVPVAASKPAAKPPVSEAQRAREILDGKPVASPQKFYVQLGVFRDEANARGVVSRAGAVGVKAVSVKDGEMHRVRGGPFVDRAAADAAAAKLKKDGLSVKVVSAK